MLNKDFIKQGNLKRYQRLYKSSGNYEWIVKYAKEMAEVEEEVEDADPMAFFQNPSVNKFVEHLNYGNSLPGDDLVQQRLGQVLSIGLSKLYSEKSLRKSPSLKGWKYGDPYNMLDSSLIPATREDTDIVLEAAKGVLDHKKNPSDRKVEYVLRNSSGLKDGIRYAIIKGYESLYNHFVYLNPVVDFLPQDANESSEELTLDSLPLSTAKLNKESGRKKSKSHYILSSTAGPRLDDMALGFRLNQVKLLLARASGTIDDKKFAVHQVLADGLRRHTESGLAGLKEYMSKEENRTARYKSDLKEEYTVGLDESGKVETLMQIATKLGLNYDELLALNTKSSKKSGLEFDPDFLDEGQKIDFYLKTELLTDNMYLGNIGEGKSYDSLTGFVRNKMNWPAADAKTKKGWEKGLYYKDWKGNPQIYKRATPAGAYLYRDFISDYIGSDPIAYKNELLKDLLKSIEIHIDYNKSAVSEEREDMLILASSLRGSNAKLALSIYNEFMNLAKLKIQKMEASSSERIVIEYEEFVSSLRDAFMRKYSGEILNAKDVYNFLGNLIPRHLEVGALNQHVYKETGGKLETKIKARDLSNYYKDNIGGKDVVNTLLNTNGYLTSKYAENDLNYKKWEDEYGGNIVSQNMKKTKLDQSLINDELLVSLGMVAPTFENKKEFLVSVWKFIKENRGVDEIKTKLGDVSYQALFVYISRKISALFYEDIGINLAKTWMKDEVYGGLGDSDQVGDVEKEEEDETRGGGGESLVQAARRKIKEGEGDVPEFLNSRAVELNFLENGALHPYFPGGEIEDFYRSGSSKYDEILDINESEAYGRMLAYIKQRYGFSIGKYMYDRNKAEFNALINSDTPNSPNSIPEAMEKIGVFADLLHTRKKMAQRAEKEEELLHITNSLDFYLALPEPKTEDVLEQVAQLEKEKKTVEKQIRNLNYDTAEMAFDRLHSKIGKTPSWRKMQAYTSYVEDQWKKYIAIHPSMEKLLVRYKENDPFSNDPYNTNGSPRKMSPGRIVDVVDNFVNVEQAIVQPIEKLVIAAGKLDVENKDDLKSFLGDGRKTLKKISKRENQKLNNISTDILQLLNKVLKVKVQEEMVVLRNALVQGLLALQEVAEELAESVREDVETFIGNIPEEIEEVKVTNQASAQRYIESLVDLTEKEKEEIISAIWKMPKSDFDGTDTFMKSLSLVIQDKNIQIAKKESVFLNFDSYLPEEIVEDEDIEEALEDQTGLGAKLELFVSKYDYLTNVTLTPEINIKRLREYLGIVENGLKESLGLGVAVKKLTPEEEFLIRDQSSEAEELDGNLRDFKDLVENEISNRVQTLPLTQKDVSEEIEEVEYDDILEEEPVDLEEEGYDVIEELADELPSVDLEENDYEVLETEPVPTTEEVPQAQPQKVRDSTDVLVDIASGLRAIVDSRDDIMDMDESGSLYTNMLEFAGKLENSKGAAVQDQKMFDSFVNSLLKLISTPSYEGAAAIFMGDGYKTLQMYLESTIQKQKISSLKKFETSSEKSNYVVKVSVVGDDDDFYFF